MQNFRIFGLMSSHPAALVWLNMARASYASQVLISMQLNCCTGFGNCETGGRAKSFLLNVELNMWLKISAIVEGCKQELIHVL